MKKILVVDDSVFIRSGLKAILNSDEFLFYTAVDGIEALDVFKKEQPDLVLLDILMPNMDGIAAFREMKKINSDAKIIVLSALEKSEIESKLSEYSADGYFNKPFDVDKLVSKVNEILKT